MARIARNPEHQKFKAKNWKTVQDKQFISLMNDSKWIQLQYAVQCLDFPPAYVIKLLTEEQDKVFEKNFMDHIPSYWGNWSAVYEEGMPCFFNIEYMIVHPRYSKYQGMLIDPLIVDEYDAFRQILMDLNLTFDEVNCCFIVHAYMSV